MKPLLIIINPFIDGCYLLGLFIIIYYLYYLLCNLIARWRHCNMKCVIYYVVVFFQLYIVCTQNGCRGNDRLEGKKCMPLSLVV